MSEHDGDHDAFEDAGTDGIRPRAAYVAVGLRLPTGWIFPTAGLGKLTGEPFDAADYLVDVDPASPTAGVYGAMAANPKLMDLIVIRVGSRPPSGVLRATHDGTFYPDD